MLSSQPCSAEKKSYVLDLHFYGCRILETPWFGGYTKILSIFYSSCSPPVDGVCVEGMIQQKDIWNVIHFAQNINSKWEILKVHSVGLNILSSYRNEW